MKYITDRLIEQVCEEIRTWKCFPSQKSDVGAKHLDDNSSVKPKIYNPNASPSESLETNPGKLQLFIYLSFLPCKILSSLGALCLLAAKV